MSEKLHLQHESGQELDYHVEPAIHEAHKKTAEHEAANHEQDKAEKLETLKQTVEREAESQQESEAIQAKHDQDKDKAQGHVSKQVKHHTAKQTLRQARKELPVYQRGFSKVVHNPAVDIVSSAAEQTIARPSGLLGGGLLSLVGSLVVLFVCRFYGYEYNYTIGLACLAGGFLLGMFLEIIIKSGRRLRA